MKMTRTACLLLLASTAVAAQPPDTALELDTRIASQGGALWREIPPRNQPVPLTGAKPAAIVREPAYRGTPRYGAIRLGNGPHGLHHVVVDHEAGDDPAQRRLYIDANRNGDLTDDGDGRWKTLSRQPNNVTVGAHPAVLRASWGDATTETGSADYAVIFVYLPDRERPGEYALSYRGTTARVGRLGLGDRTVRVVAVETDADAVFDLGSSNPVHLFVDADDDGFFDWNERFDAREPFALGGSVYTAGFTPDGARLTLAPTDRPAQQLKERRITRPEQRVLLGAGTAAPDFVALRAEGGEMRLSDYRGRIVILDFWAPWCGPCKASMPGLDQLYRETKDEGVVVLGLCVWDTRAAFDRWLAKPQVPTSYPLAFDPAGRNTENQNADSIASRLYHVTGIPTFYVIDREGKIAAAFVGSGEQSKQGLRDALVRLGVRL